jgi:hypothetical protein
MHRKHWFPLCYSIQEIRGEVLTSKSIGQVSISSIISSWQQVVKVRQLCIRKIFFLSVKLSSFFVQSWHGKFVVNLTQIVG